MEWTAFFILAQASSGGLSDFMRQVPVGLIVMFCGTGIVLIAVLLVIVRVRVQRRERPHRERPVVPVSAATKSAAPLSSESTEENELPDLDMLVSRPSVPKPSAPAPNTPPAHTMRSDAYQVRLDSGGATQAVEVVTILRDVVDGGLIIQMGDRAYRDLSGDEAFRDRFLKVMRELSPVVAQATARKPATAPLQKPAAPAEAATKESQAEPEVEYPTPSVRDLLVSAEEADEDIPEPVIPPTTPVSPPPASGENVPGDLPRYSLDDEPQVVKKRAGLLGRTKTEYVPVPELNLAEAIEAYLQHKLANNQDYAGRSIHVHPAPDGGVAIEVDGQFYDSVGDVRESDVRAYLAATIQEWQQRNTGK